MPKGIYKHPEHHNHKTSNGGGWHLSEARIQQIREINTLRLKGRKPTKQFLEMAKNQVGENHWEWKGNKASYSAIHHWVKRWRGKPSECAYCGNEENTQWASISHESKRDLDDYFPLCSHCHNIYDDNGKLSSLTKYKKYGYNTNYL